MREVTINEQELVEQQLENGLPWKIRAKIKTLRDEANMAFASAWLGKAVEAVGTVPIASAIIKDAFLFATGKPTVTPELVGNYVLGTTLIICGDLLRSVMQNAGESRRNQADHLMAQATLDILKGERK